MPTLQNFRDAYYEHSGRASDIARTLALSAIAAVWIFKQDGAEAGTLVLGPQLLWVGFLAVAALACDLMQYLWSAAVFGTWTRSLEKNGTGLDDEVTVPAWFNRPSLVLFVGKQLAVAAAYCFLLQYLVTQLRAG